MSGYNTQTGSQLIPGLPAIWNIAIKLITTQGLAVFLVLFYLFAIRPEDIVRDELLDKAIKEVTELRQEVEMLARTIESGDNFITRDQADKLKSLYRDAVTDELTHLIIEKAQNGASVDELESSIRSAMLPYTKSLEGQIQKGSLKDGGGSIAGWLRDRIFAENGICGSIAQEAIDNNWGRLQHEQISRKLKKMMRDSFVLPS